MATPKPTFRDDVIRNAVSHQIQELEDSAAPLARLAPALNSELNHDLITWPRQYLEPYLDPNESGRVPLSPEQLQDVLEAAFERDEALALGFLQEVKIAKEARTLPGSSLQIAKTNPSDSEHAYELYFNEANTGDLKRLWSKITRLAHERQGVKAPVPRRGQDDIERRETTSLTVEYKRDSAVIQIPEKHTGIDVRKLLGGADLPQRVQLALKELQPEARIDRALTDSGVYRGSVIAETAHDLIQRISVQSVVIHRKDELDSSPRIGDHVRINYSEGIGHVRQVRERSRGKELAR